jgi:hypothetical protein
MRVSTRWFVLLLLAVASAGCDRRPKDEIPTRIEPPPKQQPQPGNEQAPP